MTNNNSESLNRLINRKLQGRPCFKKSIEILKEVEDEYSKYFLSKQKTHVTTSGINKRESKKNERNTGSFKVQKIKQQEIQSRNDNNFRSSSSNNLLNN